MSQKRSHLYILVLSIIILATAFIPMKNYTSKLIHRMNNYLPKNLYINSIHVGDKTLKQAAEEMERLEKEQLRKQITITYDDENGYYQANSFTYEQLGYYADKAAVFEQLNTIMDKNKSIFKRFIQYNKIERSRADCMLSFCIHYDKFLKALEVFDESALKPAVNAKFDCNKGNVKIINEIYGYSFDKDQLYKDLLTKKEPVKEKLNVKAVKPEVTSDQLETYGVQELIAKYTTYFDSSNVPRSANIRLAAQLIDGTTLAPKAAFSFNEVVGDRTADRGFFEAGVYRNGKLDTGIGGGVCQVSTTLYNAALLADIEITDRSNHSLTVPYVPLSRDAAVSWGSQDLKFINNTEYHIFLRGITTSNTITFELYSTKSNKQVELISEKLSETKAPIVYIDDPALMQGQEEIMDKGHEGFQSKLTKNVYIDGQLVSSTVLSKDKYLTAVKVIKRGTKLPEVSEEPDFNE